MILLFLIGLGYVLYDLMRNPTTIDESQNKPITGEVTESRFEMVTIENKYYQVDIPSDWVEINRPQRIFEEGIRYYPYRYQGTTGDSAGRWLEVYAKDIPLIPSEKIVQVTAMGDKLSVGNISPQCIEFAEYDEDTYNRNADVPAAWNELEFLCRLSTVGNTIAAVETSVKDGYTLEGANETPQQFLLVFADQGSREDNTLFQTILRSFQAK